MGRPRIRLGLPCEICRKPLPRGAQSFCSKDCANAARTTKPEERFWPKVNKNGPIHPVLGTRCWLWTGATDKGYGAVSMPPSKARKAHRVAWELLNGPLPRGTNVLHKCDVRSCVNAAEHLFIGTLTDNNKDMRQKGRARGGYNTLCPEQVRAIRAATGTQLAIARQFGISQPAVFNIRHRNTYKHVQ